MPSAPTNDVTRPWWKAPVPMAFGGVILLSSLAVIFENRLIPQKPVDPRSKITLPGGGSFCDPLPVPPATPDAATASHSR